MTNRLFDLAIYLLAQANRQMLAAVTLYEQSRWFDGYFVGLWGQALSVAGDVVGNLAQWLDGGGQS